VESGTRAHREPFGYSGVTGSGGRRRYATRGQVMASGEIASRKRASRRRFLFIPGVGFRTRVQHPGTQGSQPVGRAMGMAGREAGAAGVAVFRRAIRDHLGG
jgi:hypothetical protein